MLGDQVCVFFQVRIQVIFVYKHDEHIHIFSNNWFDIIINLYIELWHISIALKWNYVNEDRINGGVTVLDLVCVWLMFHIISSIQDFVICRRIIVCKWIYGLCCWLCLVRLCARCPHAVCKVSDPPPRPPSTLDPLILIWFVPMYCSQIAWRSHSHHNLLYSVSVASMCTAPLN